MTKSNTKYLLCRPCGGLNDTLNQIERCISYSKRFNRVLVLDTVIGNFKDSFDNYFTLKPEINNVILYNQNLKSKLEKLSCYPKEIQGKIDTYESTVGTYYPSTDKTLNKKNSGWLVRLEKKSKAIISFNFDKNYEEELLIHHQHGGGRLSFKMIQKITVKPEISNRIKNLIKLHENNYISVHIRHTDIKSNYKKILNDLKEKEPQSKIFLATDSYECQNYAQNLFQDRLFYSFQIPNTNETPLHYFASKNFSVYERNSLAIIDLCVLAKGKKLYNCGPFFISYFINFFKKIFFKNYKPFTFSGYSRLAYFLHTHPNILNKLIG